MHWDLRRILLCGVGVSCDPLWSCFPGEAWRDLWRTFGSMCTRVLDVALLPQEVGQVIVGDEWPESYFVRCWFIFFFEFRNLFLTLTTSDTSNWDPQGKKKHGNAKYYIVFGSLRDSNLISRGVFTLINTPRFRLLQWAQSRHLQTLHLQLPISQDKTLIIKSTELSPSLQIRLHRLAFRLAIQLHKTLSWPTSFSYVYRFALS